MPIYQYHNLTPNLAPNTYIAPTAVLIGQVTVHTGASVWFGSVLRADNEPIIVGKNTNIQENCILHNDKGAPLTLGAHVTVGHGVTLHGCTIGDNSLIGMGAIILNHAVIGANSIVGAGALVTEGKQFPPNALIVGSPAKVVRELTAEEIAKLPQSAHLYAQRGADYALNLHALPDTAS